MSYYLIELFNPDQKHYILAIIALVIFWREKVQEVAMPIFFFQSNRTNKQNKCA